MAIDMKRIETGENINTEFKREYIEEIVYYGPKDPTVW